MKLSVIIVNYNVGFYLQQCLLSVFKSRNIDFEVFVVDNNSTDNSCDIIKNYFPHVKLIENNYNAGFSKANNQALALAKGKYALLLNPDTVIAEDTLENVYNFMEETPDAGALGVKMIDGYGRFLPESKRGFPSPFVSFSKIFGLSALFPKSHFFGKYHLRYLDENSTHIVDILAGAFMLLRTETLQKTGLLDETFFMYGEDIDMSYRVTLAGYNNYYLPESIIHYKGESTQKDSLKYVKIFYESILIFFKKHYQKSNIFFTASINFAIFFRAALAALKRIFKYILPFKKEEIKKVALIGSATRLKTSFTGCIEVSEKDTAYLSAIIKKNKINFLVLSTEDYSYKKIIALAEAVKKNKCEIAIYHPTEKLLISTSSSREITISQD